MGVIHSHPRDDSGAPSDDDWDNTDILINEGLADDNNFSNYILDGNNGRLNEFDNDKNNRRLDEPNRRTRDDAQGSCDNV